MDRMVVMLFGKSFNDFFRAFRARSAFVDFYFAIHFLHFHSSSFRRPTLLASPTPKYCFKGVGEAGPKNEGEAEIEFLINFHAIFYF